MRKLVMLPGPTNVPTTVMSAMLESIINHRGKEFSSLYKNLQTGAQYAFQTSNEIVILSASGTGGVDAAAGSIISQGDCVVVPKFGEFSGRLGESARYAGASVISPSAPLGQVPSVKEIELAMKGAVKPKALFVVYNETSTGVTWRKLKELSEICSKYGTLFVVDAISVLGGDVLPVDKLGVDICIAGSQKCLAAPPGAAILSFSQSAKDVIKTVSPKTQSFDISRYFAFAEHGETPFTPSLPIFFALNESLRLVKQEGIERRIKRHEVCAKSFYSAFQSMGLKIFAVEESRSNTVLGILYPSGIKDNEFRSLLSDKFGILVSGGFGEMKGKMFRVGCMGIVDEAIVTRTISGIAHSLNHLGFACDSGLSLRSAWDALSELKA